MKKQLHFLLVLCSCVFLASCASNEVDYALVEPETTEELSSQESKESSEESSDESSNESSEEQPEQDTEELRVFEKEEFTTQEIPDDTLAEGERVVVQIGEDGQSEITYKITKEDGEEVSREAISERVIKKAVAEIVHVGTGLNVAAQEETTTLEDPSETATDSYYDNSGYTPTPANNDYSQPSTPASSSQASTRPTPPPESSSSSINWIIPDPVESEPTEPPVDPIPPEEPPVDPDTGN